MRRVLALVLAVLVAATCGSARAELSKMVVRRVKAATVYIEVVNTANDGTVSTSTGSGFVIDPSGLVLTNHHVVSDQIETGPGVSEPAASQAITVSFLHGTADQVTYEATTVKEHAAVDLALLQLPPGTYDTLELGDSGTATETQTVYAAGHPLGLSEISLRTGTVTSMRTLEGYPYIEHSVNIQQGNSGGPLFDGDGNVIGVNVFMLRDEAGAIASYAIRTETIARFLADELPDETAGGGTGKAFLQALLDQAALIYNKLDDDTYELPYENATVYVSAAQGWVRIRVPLGTPAPETAEETYALYDKLLRANYNYCSGRFGLDTDGGLWLEMSVRQDDISYTTLTAYAGHIATMAGLYVDDDLQVAARPSGSLALAALPRRFLAAFQQDGMAADVGGPLTLGEILDAAELTYEELDSGAFKLPYEGDVTIFASVTDSGWMVMQTFLGALGELSEEERVELYGVLLTANCTRYVGKYGLDSDGDLWVEHDALFEGLTPGSARTYGAFLAGVAGSFAQGKP